jgi:hypothetical protein
MSTHGEAVQEIKKAKEIVDFVPTDDNPQYPDAKKHKYISFVKSGLRIVACGFLAYYEIQTAAVLFLLAEILGIAEELV